MTPADMDFTRAWWSALLKDEAKMVRFLQKLHATEYSGYKDNQDAAAKWTKVGSGASHVFLKTGDDEKRHADLLENVLRGRGAWPVEQVPAESIYWTEMDKFITSLEHCAAVFHYGEQLAAERFQIIGSMPETPLDIMGFLIVATPDENHHANIFRKLSNHEAMMEIAMQHTQIVERLKAS